MSEVTVTAHGVTVTISERDRKEPGAYVMVTYTDTPVPVYLDAEEIKGGTQLLVPPTTTCTHCGEPLRWDAEEEVWLDSTGVVEDYCPRAPGPDFPRHEAAR